MGKTGFLVFESNLYHLKEHQKRNKTAKTAFRYETYGPNYAISKIYQCIPPDPWFSSKDDCSGIIYSFIQNKLSFLVPQTFHCVLKSTVKISYMQPKQQGQFNKKTLKFRVISPRGSSSSTRNYLRLHCEQCFDQVEYTPSLPNAIAILLI